MSDVILTLPEMHPKQQRILNEAARFNVLNCGRRFGKNILLHDRVVTALLDGKKVGWLSPTYKNLDEDWEIVLKLLGPVIAHKDETDKNIDTITGGRLDMWTFENPGVIRGHAYHRFIFNETAHAKQVMTAWNEIVRATLADYKGDAWFASTPKGMNDWHTFYSWGLGNMPE